MHVGRATRSVRAMRQAFKCQSAFTSADARCGSCSSKHAMGCCRGRLSILSGPCGRKGCQCKPYFFFFEAFLFCCFLTRSSGARRSLARGTNAGAGRLTFIKVLCQPLGRSRGVVFSSSPSGDFFYPRTWLKKSLEISSCAGEAALRTVIPALLCIFRARATCHRGRRTFPLDERIFLVDLARARRSVRRLGIAYRLDFAPGLSLFFICRDVRAHYS